MTAVNSFILLALTRSQQQKMATIIAFPGQKWFRERVTMLRYTTVPVLLKLCFRI